MSSTGRVFCDGTLGRPQLDHPEGIAVHPDGSVWCGGERGQIYRIEPDGSSFDVVASTDGFVLGVAFAPTGELYACDLFHGAVFRLDAAGTVDRFAEGFETPNSPAVAADGTLYVSDSNRPGPGIYRFTPGGEGGLWCDGPFDFANGLALAPDGSAVYVVESFLPGVSRVQVLPDGSPGERAVVVTLPDTVPDGIAFGPDGALYVGCYEPSQVLRVDLATSAVTTVLADPTAHLLCHPTNVAFRGDQLFTSNLGRWHVTVIEGLAG